MEGHESGDRDQIINGHESNGSWVQRVTSPTGHESNDRWTGDPLDWWPVGLLTRPT